MLAEDVEYGTYNNSLKVFATAFGMTDLRFSGPDDYKTCNYCALYVGNVYHRGQFSPILPAHIHCRHTWEIVRSGPPPDIFAEMQKETQKTQAPTDIFSLLSVSGA
jgi:hypothetical protein